jgi:hypothetical protein
VSPGLRTGAAAEAAGLVDQHFRRAGQDAAGGEFSGEFGEDQFAALEPDGDPTEWKDVGEFVADVFCYGFGVAAGIEAAAHTEQDIHHFIRLGKLMRELIREPMFVGGEGHVAVIMFQYRDDFIDLIRIAAGEWGE